MSGSAWLGIVTLALVAGAVALGVLRCEGSPPVIEAPAELVLGRTARSVPVTVSDDGTGLRRIEVTLVHAEGEAPLGGFREPRLDTPFAFSRPAAHDLEVSLDGKALGLREGSARLRVTARDGSWRDRLRGNETTLEIPVTIDFTPPRVRLESGLTYTRRGGAGALAYVLREPVERDGVVVGEEFFPGFEAGSVDGEPRRVALFAVPVDAPDDASIEILAVDRAGNESRVRPAVRIQERQRLPEVPIRLSTGFLQEKVVPLARREDIDASDPVAAFQEINTTLRAANEARVRELLADSSSEPLFQGAFQQLPNSKVTSFFAERRAYLVEGKRVSEAIHYGYDLASTSRAPVTAANAGRVVHAGWLGIYGDCVLLDHGLGVASLYGHLSSLEVSEGDRVEKGHVLGRSGDTGLAGGDHLHFAILVDDAYVDPLEWWDPKWVRERIAARLDAPAP